MDDETEALGDLEDAEDPKELADPGEPVAEPWADADVPAADWLRPTNDEGVSDGGAQDQ